MLVSTVDPELIQSWQADLEDSQELMSIGLLVSLSAVNGNTAHEKLDIDKDAAELLASVIKLGQDDDFPDMWPDEPATGFKGLRLEEPILLSDPQLDLIRLNDRNTAAISTKGMQPFTEEEISDLPFISDEKDAAMRETLEQSTNERFDIDRSMVDYLGEICKQLEGDGDDDIAALLGQRKVRTASKGIYAG